MSGPALGAEPKYLCSDFVADFMLVSGAKDGQKPNPTPHFTKTVAMLMGVFMGAKHKVVEDADEPDLIKFERAVVGECSAKPGARVEEVAISVAPGSAPTDLKKPTEGYTPIDLTDLKLDKAKLRGKKIEVTGFLQTMGDMSMLSEGLFDMNKIFVETDKLPRDTRKFLLESCDSGCQVTIRGTVTTVMMGEGIAADAVVP